MAAIAYNIKAKELYGYSPTNKLWNTFFSFKIIV